MQAMVLEVAAYFVPDALRGVGSDAAVERVNVPTDPDLDQHRSAAMAQRGEIPTAPVFLASPSPLSLVALDSPLAIDAAQLFRRTAASLDPSIDLDRLLSSPQLRFTETVDESKSIARLSGFHIIIAASGMCDAGRIRHHLKRWLWRSEATVLLVGFQAQGTLGRFLHDGAKAVRIQGEEINVAARIRYLDEYSGHADGPELARWIASRRPIHRGVFLTH